MSDVDPRPDESFAAALLARASDVVAVVGPDGNLTYVSPAARTMLGYGPAALIGTSAFDLVHPSDQVGALEGFDSTSSAADSRPTPLLLRLRNADGTWRETEVIATNHLDDPAIGGLLLSIRDVSQSMRTERALRDSEERYRLIVELACEGIWVVDAHGTTTYANRAMARMLDTTVNRLIGCSLFDFLDEDTQVRARMTFGQGAAAEVEEHDFRLVTRAGHSLWTRVNITPVLLPDGTFNGAIALVTDVTDRRCLEEQLAREARIDSLTGVANRNTLFDVLSRQLAHPALCGVFFADLDRFKSINDTYGHQAGDQTLRVVAERLSSIVRHQDTVARVGGDEFVVVSAPLRDEAEALEIGNRIPRALDAPVRIGDLSISVDLSVGIAFSTGEDDADSLLARADNALYRAKRNGRARIEVISAAS